MKNELYERLGLTPEATSKEINAAYRRLAKECHPDAHPGDEAKKERFHQIKESRDVLMDPETREHYDQTGQIKSERLDEVRQSALNLIFSNLISLIDNNNDPERVDWMKTLEQLPQQGRAGLDQDEAQVTKSLAKFERVQARFRNNKEQENLLSRGLQQRIDALRASLAEFAKARAMFRVVEEILNEHSFDQLVDAPNPSAFYERYYGARPANRISFRPPPGWNIGASGNGV